MEECEPLVDKVHQPIKEPQAQYGLYMQYLAVGLIYGGLPATIYPVFLGYLNVPGYVYATAGTIVTLPWSFKFVFGAINDRVPLFGYRRKPYMVFGWFACCCALIRLSLMEMPPPYWCEDGSVCNPAAAKEGGRLALWLMLASVGYCVADVAADGLTVTLARKEPASRRGQTQTTVYLVRTIGNVLAIGLVGVCMNSKQYNGSFTWGLSFPSVCGIFSVPAAAMVPCSWWLHEPRTHGRADVWKLVQSKAFFYVILFEFLTPVISGISTTAAGEVKEYWAHVNSLQNALASVLGHVLFAVGLGLVRAKFLNASWRTMTALTTCLLNVIDMPFTFLTIFAIVRNQYFYLGEVLLLEIPAAVNFVVATFVIVEMADDGDEGLVYGLCTTVANLGSPFANAISNQLFRFFRPSLSNSANYIQDTASFRWLVASSFVVSYFASFASLLTLPLLPDQKDMTHYRRRTWPRSPFYAYATLALLVFGLAYSVTVNILAIFPSTTCMPLAGGDGC